MNIKVIARAAFTNPYVVGVALSVIVAAAATAGGGVQVPGFITEPGYEHGYAICDKPDIVSVNYPGLEYIESDKYTIYVNEGHKTDRQVQDLHLTAIATCP